MTTINKDKVEEEETITLTKSELAAMEERIMERLKSEQPIATRPLPHSTAFWGEDGALYWRPERMSEGGSYTTTARRLSLTLEEARQTKTDFIHPTLGVIWEGYKLARDRGTKEILADNSLGGATPPGERSVAEALSLPTNSLEKGFI